MTLNDKMRPCSSIYSWGEHVEQEGSYEDQEMNEDLPSQVTTEDSRYTLYQEEIGYKAPKSHRELELYLAELSRDNEALTEEANLSNFNHTRVSIITAQEECGRPRKYERILGMGVDYPHSPVISYGQRESTQSPSPATNTNKVKERIGSISGIMSALSLPKLSRKNLFRSEPPTLSIVHTSYIASQEKLRLALNSQDPNAALEAWTPPVFRKYDAQAKVNVSGLLVGAEKNASQSTLGSKSTQRPIPPFHDPFITQPYTSSLSHTTCESSEVPRKYSGTSEFSQSTAEFFAIPPLAPFARQTIERRQSDPIYTMSATMSSTMSSSRPGPFDRHSNLSTTEIPYALVGNPKADHDYWYRQITEDDITFPRHTEVEDRDEPIFIRPGWFDGGLTQEELFRRNRDEEILRLSRLAPDESLPRKTSASSDTMIGRKVESPREPRPESRWSAYSDKQPNHSWRQPFLWGTKKKGSFDSHRSKESSIKTPKLAPSNKIKEAKFKIISSEFFRKAIPRRLSSESAISPRQSARNSSSNESVIPYIDPVAYAEPHPGDRISISRSGHRPTRFLKNAYDRLGNGKAKRVERRREELKGKIRKLTPTEPEPFVSGFWV
ncbi:hypothetical protein BDZ91DRAFT_781589 [Kalaharituber pfeilii]|nr:hypothetical protein BDZ91DRAFT_781589 [Kalaharituber pfeilii]